MNGIVNFLNHLSQASGREGRSSEGSDVETAASSGYGHSGYGGGRFVYADEEEECETGLNPFLLAATAAIAAGAAFLIFNQVTTGGKKKRSVGDLFSDALTLMSKFGHLGLEDFEGKIEKIAGGVDKDENSWLNKLYKQYNGETLSQTLSEQADEAATSEDEQENRAFRKKRANEEVIEKEDNAIKAIYDNVENTCSTKFWRCISNVVEGGIQYSEMPGGLTGAMKKHLMKVVFAGGISNMWESLMTVPEARKFQKCMSKQRECNEYQVLRRALNSEQTHPQRLLVVPEAVEIQEEDQE